MAVETVYEIDDKLMGMGKGSSGSNMMDTVMYGAGDEGAVARITDAMRRGVKEAVGTLIVEFGSYGKAPLVEPATLEDMAARYAKEG